MKDVLKQAMKEAMKARQKVELTTIRSLIAAIQYEEMQKGDEELDEKAIIALFKNELKKRTEAIEFEQKAGRTEQIADLETEAACIKRFLPEQMSDEKLRSVLEEFKTENPDAAMGIAMKHLKEHYAGQYDGKAASSVAKELFA